RKLLLWFSLSPVLMFQADSWLLILGGRMGYLVLLRHGESLWNLENRFTGWVEVPLSPKGEEEARQAGEKLKAAGLRFDCAFTSVLQRAIRTLEIVLEVLGQRDLPVEKDQAFNERHY